MNLKTNTFEWVWYSWVLNIDEIELFIWYLKKMIDSSDRIVEYIIQFTHTQSERDNILTWMIPFVSILSKQNSFRE